MTEETQWLREAIELARENVSRGGRPFGAVVVRDGRVVARGVNETHAANDPTAHAELLALRAAGRALGTPVLAGCAVYASGHPCPMCLAAMTIAGVERVAYAYSLDEGAPYGLTSAPTYAELAKPPEQRAMRLVHVPVRAEGEHPYALWAKARGAGVRGTTHVRRHVAAPRSCVYRALLDPEAVQRWMVPTGMTSEVHEYDAREGGHFRVSLTYDEPTGTGKTTAHTDTYHGRFAWLVPDEQVVQVLEFETGDPAMQGEMTMRFTLTDAADGGTDLEAVHENVPPGVRPEDNELGWRMSLTKLAALCEARHRAEGAEANP